jgi:segregation and condensation protein B
MKEGIEDVINEELKNMKNELTQGEDEEEQEEIQGEGEALGKRVGALNFERENVIDELDSIFDEKERELEEKVEAALFISAKFLSLQDLLMLTDINPIMLKEILNNLEKKYSRGAVKIINKNNSWKMDVSEKYHHLINRLATGNSEFTKAEQETLAVIAYKQPVKQSVIIHIRGNKGYEHVKKFRELGMVEAKRAGHTMELKLSEDFYEYFHVIEKDGKMVEEKELEEEGIEENEKENNVKE